MALSTDFKDDVLASSNSKRKYNMIHNPDGTVSFEDVTVYSQEGSDFGAKEVNEEREEINKHTTLLGDTDISSIEDGTVTGALARLNGKLIKENFSFGYIDETYSFVGQSYKENGKVYINGYFHKDSPKVGMVTCAFVPSGFRPKVRCGSAGYTDDDYSYNQIGGIKINTTGDVTLSFPTVYSTNLYVSVVYDVE